MSKSIQGKYDKHAINILHSLIGFNLMKMLRQILVISHHGLKKGQRRSDMRWLNSWSWSHLLALPSATTLDLERGWRVMVKVGGTRSQWLVLKPGSMTV